MAYKLTNSYTLRDWISLRDKLENKALLTVHWDEAVRLFRERINERYFDPLRLLIDNSNNKGEGFTILTIECTLIEFLATLEDGRIFKKDKLPTDRHCYYKRSSRIYQHFLRTANIFDPYFSSSQGEKPLFSTQDFYLNVRCALIHEAQTRENWEVKIFKTKSDDMKNRVCFVRTAEGQKLIYRTALFKLLSDYFENFTSVQLKQETERGRTIRKHLARKIDHIAEIRPDTRYWWD